jgi:ubiquinone/menaquinone biosynthesis C-methylase UbiE
VHERFAGQDWHEVRLDIDPGAEPDIVSSIIDMAVVDEMSVDAVWSSHNIEHVFAHEVPLVLHEFHRVLRPGGMALIATPDLQAAAKLIAMGRLEVALYHTEAGPIMPLDVVYGYGGSIKLGNEFMAHRTGFTAQTLAGKLNDAGFERVAVTRAKQELALLACGYRPAVEAAA